MTISVQTHTLKVNYFLQIGKRMWLFSADRALMEKTRVPRVERSNTVRFCLISVVYKKAESLNTYIDA